MNAWTGTCLDLFPVILLLTSKMPQYACFCHSVKFIECENTQDSSRLSVSAKCDVHYYDQLIRQKSIFQF